MNLLVPVLPGKSEAWRRFLQELEGSRAADFVTFCKNLDVKVVELKLLDSLGCALVLLTLEIREPSDFVKKFGEQQSLFNYWLMDQVRTLHGLDLTKLQQKGEL